MHKKLSLPVAIFYIVLSILLISGGGYGFLRRIEKAKKMHTNDLITTILQTGPEKEALKTEFFAEMLNLSCDRPISQQLFPIRKAELLLKNHPIIKDAELRFLDKNTLYINYEVKKPIAYLGNFENLGIDEEGNIFPIKPFLKKVRLPEIFFSEKDFAQENILRTNLKNQSFQTALELIHFFFEKSLAERFWIKQVDVSQIFSESYGKREIILSIENEKKIKKGNREYIVILPHIVRLHAKEYLKAACNYLELRNRIIEEENFEGLQNFDEERKVLPAKILDFRIPRLAFIK
ncbi:MAG: hypothetical protein Tsb0015_00450 [Simkaniaceae bacterium]